MRKLLQLALAVAGVIGSVFGVALLFWWITSRNMAVETPAERRAKDLQQVRTILAKWDSFDAAARTAAMPELSNKVWQFTEGDYRWQATLDLGHAGPGAAAYLVPLLKHPDDEVRMYAAWGLGILGPECPEPKKVLEALQERLHDDNIDVRQTAVFAVWRVAPGADDAVPVLVGMLGDSDADVRDSAGRAVARFGKSAVPALRKALKNPSADMRRQAVVTLGLIGPEAAPAVPDLLALLRDPQSGLQDKTAEALAGIGAPAVGALAEALKQEPDSAFRKRVILALPRIGAPAVPVLTDVLKDKDPSVRLQTVTALGQIGAPAVAAVVVALKDEDAEVRQEVARVLGTMSASDAGVVPALVEALKDPSDQVRGRAITSLWTLRPEPATVLPALTPVLEDKSLDVRLDAIRYLREVGPAAVPRLASMLKDPDAKVCQQVIVCLEEIRAPADVLYPGLLPLLKSDNGTARQHAVTLLWRCGAQAIPQLQAALKDGDALVRVAAIRSLYQANVDPKIALPAFVAALEDDSAVVRASAAAALCRFGSPALPSLRTAVKDRDPLVRERTVLSLQEMKGTPKDVLPLVEEAIQDTDVKVRVAATASLRSFGLAAVPTLIAALKDKDEAVWKQAVDSLKKVEGSQPTLARIMGDALKDEHYAVRKGAAYVLSRFGADAVDPLLGALKDEDGRVRYEAADSLRVVGPQAEKAMGPLAALAVSDPDATVRKAALAAMLSIHGLFRFRDEPLKAVPNLIESLQARHAQTRWEAAEILDVLGPPAKEAVGALTKASQDKDARVRQAATAALARIRGS